MMSLTGSQHAGRSIARFGKPAAGPVVFVIAVAARFAFIVRHDAFDSLFGYDSGVYFAGSDALIHGRLPYRDYVQLHPPGITLALTPFAALTHLISDSAAFDAATIAFVLLGGLNAWLVVQVCGRLELGTGAALVGGLFYALWLGAAGTEFLIKLEPLANTMLLFGMLAALRCEHRTTWWPALLAGLPLGVAVSVKIWWVVPALGVVVWHGSRTGTWRRSVAIAGGLVAAAVVINVPFFVAAPHQMWSMILADQFDRPQTGGVVNRLEDISTVTYFHNLSAAWSTTLLIVVAALGLVAVSVASLTSAARLFAALAAVQVLVVLAAPSWFPYYADYLAVPFAVVIAAASAHRAWQPARVAPISLTAILSAFTIVLLGNGTLGADPYHEAPRLARVVAHVRCVMSDSPAAQIRLDALSRGLADGCRNWVDVVGPLYGPYRPASNRFHNAPWHRALRNYLDSGAALVVVRPAGTGITPAFLRTVTSSVLGQVGDQTVYRTRRP